MSNYFEIIEKALRDILTAGLVPFVKREMKAKYGADWITSDKVPNRPSYHLVKGEGDLNWSDMQAVLSLVIEQWNSVFTAKLKPSARSLIFELKDIRNSLKHEDRDKFDFDYSFRALDNIERLLSALPNDRIAAGKAIEAATEKRELLTQLIEIQSVKDKSTFPWHEVFGVMLLEKQRDTLRRKATEIGAEVNVYVKLDLIRPEEMPSSSKNPDRDQDDKRNLPKVLKTYEHDKFLKSLTDRHSSNKHIAIAGEAGAGKTTLLASIAKELHEQKQLPIFISLADLQEKSLDKYIDEVWLPKALGIHRDSVTAEQKNDLVQQFENGKIWLLLDGLDEMRSKSSKESLGNIERQINEVIRNSRVILTCRLNVWGVRGNLLPNFDTFEMDYFSLDQVDEFINKWFLSIECLESAEILQTKLREPNRDRIRDMVRHPLRLALLCQALYPNPNPNPNEDLPESKAGLYSLFIRNFYKWKPNIVSEDLLSKDTLREELHQALGKLAIAGIDGSEGFRLSRSLGVKKMGDDLFNLACDLGWLNLVERDEEVYSFFHATFQEYFAALAIEEKTFFLVNDPKNISSGTYRIFEPKWLEVALFWVGADEKENHEKNRLIKELLEFEESNYCFIQFRKYFYRYHAIFLTAKLMGEYINCSIDTIDGLMLELSHYAFGYFDNETQKWFTFLTPIREGAKKALSYSNRERVNDELSCLRKDVLLKALEIDDFDEAKHFLKNKFSFNESESNNGFSFNSHSDLNKIINYIISGVETLQRTIDHHQIYKEGRISISTDSALSKKQDNSNLIESIIKELNTFVSNRNVNEILKTTSALALIGRNNTIAIKAIKQLLQKQKQGFFKGLTHSEDLQILHTIAIHLLEVDQGNAEAIVTIVDLIRNESIRNTNPLYNDLVGNPFFALDYYLPQNANSEKFEQIVYELSKWISSQSKERSDDSDTLAFYFLWRCSEIMSYEDFCKAWYSQPTFIHPEVADTIPSDNVDAIENLESQLIDFNAIQQELDRTNSHPERCQLVLDISNLKDETDRDLISKRIWNKLTQKFPELNFDKVNDFGDLEFELGKLQKQLDKKLAIALYCREENPTIGKLCHDLNPIQINLLTGEQPTEKLIKRIENWLSEIELGETS